MVIVVIIVGISISVYADSFESSSSENYLFLERNNNHVSGIIQIEGKIITFDNEVDRFYKNGGFKVKLIGDKVLMFVLPDRLLVNVLDLTEREKYSFDIKLIDTTTTYEQIVEEKLTPLEKFHQAQNQTGLGNIAEQNRIEEEKLATLQEEERLQEIANKTPRSEYQSIDDVLELIVKPDFHVPLRTTFDFSLRSTDKNLNPYSQFYGGGYLDDVSITSKIIDPDGNVKKTITGNTDEEGYFEAPGLYMPDNTPLNQEWSVEISGIKYFDNIEKFSTFSIVKPFFVVVNPALFIDSNIDRFPPTGTIIITKNVNGAITTPFPEITLTCNDYDKRNTLIVGGCTAMVFAINSIDFTFSTLFDFNSNFNEPIIIPDGTHHYPMSFLNGTQNYPLLLSNGTVYHPLISNSDTIFSTVPDGTLYYPTMFENGTLNYPITFPDGTLQYPTAIPDGTQYYPISLNAGENTIYVQFTDDSPMENVSTEEISDTVVINLKE